MARGGCVNGVATSACILPLPLSLQNDCQEELMKERVKNRLHYDELQVAIFM